MKTRIWQRMFVAALLTAAAVGQSKRSEQIVQVPFAFVVAEQSLPAGRYVVTHIGETRLRIYSAGGKNAIIQTHAVQGRAPESLGKMVFHRYGSIYFLSEVWTPGLDIGQQLAESSAEKEQTATDSPIETAVLHFKSARN